MDDQFPNELVARVQAEGLQLTGEGGLLQQLTKRLLESALEGEMTDHLTLEGEMVRHLGYDLNRHHGPTDR